MLNWRFLILPVRFLLGQTIKKTYLKVEGFVKRAQLFHFIIIELDKVQGEFIFEQFWWSRSEVIFQKKEYDDISTLNFTDLAFSPGHGTVLYEGLTFSCFNFQVWIHWQMPIYFSFFFLCQKWNHFIVLHCDFFISLIFYQSFIVSTGVTFHLLYVWYYLSSWIHRCVYLTKNESKILMNWFHMDSFFIIKMPIFVYFFLLFVL